MVYRHFLECFTALTLEDGQFIDGQFIGLTMVKKIDVWLLTYRIDRMVCFVVVIIKSSVTGENDPVKVIAVIEL